MLDQPASRFDGDVLTLTDKHLEVYWLSTGIIRVVRPDGAPFDYTVGSGRGVHYLASNKHPNDDSAANAIAAGLAATDAFPGPDNASTPHPGFRVFYDDMPKVQIINRSTGRSSVWQIDGKGQLRTHSRDYRRPNGANFSAVNHPTTTFPRSRHAIFRSVPRRGAGSRAFGLASLGDVENLSFNFGQARRKNGTFSRKVLNSVRIESPDGRSFRQIESSGRIYISDRGQVTRDQISPRTARKKIRALYNATAPRPRR